MISSRRSSFRNACVFINSKYLNIAEKRAKAATTKNTLFGPKGKESLSLSHLQEQKVGPRGWPYLVLVKG